MTRISTFAILGAAALGLAACSQAMTPSRIGAQSSAPGAEASPGGAVGGANNSTHQNTDGAGSTAKP